MNPEKPRSNWWFLLPIFFGIIGGLIAYFAIKNDDQLKAKYCLCVGLILSISIIGGIIAYFILRNDSPEKAKIFLYLGILLLGVGLALNFALEGFEIPFEENMMINV